MRAVDERDGHGVRDFVCEFRRWCGLGRANDAGAGTGVITQYIETRGLDGDDRRIGRRGIGRPGLGFSVTRFLRQREHRQKHQANWILCPSPHHAASPQQHGSCRRAKRSEDYPAGADDSHKLLGESLNWLRARRPCELGFQDHLYFVADTHRGARSGEADGHTEVRTLKDPRAEKPMRARGSNG